MDDVYQKDLKCMFHNIEHDKTVNQYGSSALKCPDRKSVV